MTLKEYMKQSQPKLDQLALQAEAQREHDEEARDEIRIRQSKERQLKRYCERRDFALSKVEDHIVLAKIDLQWAERDRKHGHREDYLESMRLVAHHREKALWWYARYQKKCQQIAELEQEVT